MPERSIKVHKTDRPWVTAQLASGNESSFKFLREKVNRERKRYRKIYYKSKVKELRNTKARVWCCEIKELCGSNKGKRSNIQSIFNPDSN